MPRPYPSAHPLANSESRIALVLRGRHGPRVVELQPRLALAIAILGALLITWLLAVSVFFVMRDDLASSLVRGQTRVHHAYEDRIAALRLRIDKLAQKQLLNQDSIDGQVSDLLTRQAQLESRQALVNALAEEAVRRGLAAMPAAPRQQASTPLPATFLSGTGGPDAGQAFGPASAFAPGALPMKPTPLPNPRPLAPMPLPESPEALPLRRGSLGAPGDLSAMIGLVQSRAGLMEARQIGALRRIEHVARRAADQARQTIAVAGLDAPRLAAQLPDSGSGTGGPLIPLQSRQEADAFEAAARAAAEALSDSVRLGRVVEILPIRRPMSEDHGLSSGFGPRLDPFTRGLAMHAGVDFRAPHGAPVRATAPGRVIDAGWRGGYGRMIEIEHAFGFTTRYAHLAAILVQEGDKVESGTLIGQVGSTGRSTGPHLHYEVRRADDATDPVPFLKAADRL